MRRAGRLLILLAVLLGIPALLDRPARAPGSPGVVPVPAGRGAEAILGLRLPLHDAETGRLLATITVQRAERASQTGLRFLAHDIEVVMEPPPQTEAGRTTIRAPRGELSLRVPAGASGSLLEMVRTRGTRLDSAWLQGGVAAVAADGTRAETEQIEFTAEEDGRLTGGRVPGPIAVAGPGLALTAAAGAARFDGVWVLEGPVHGTVAGGADGPSLAQVLPGGRARLAQLGPRRLELDTEGPIHVRPSDAGVRELLAPEGALLVERTPAGVPTAVLDAVEAVVRLRESPIGAGGASVAALDGVRVTGVAAVLAPRPDGLRCDAYTEGAWDAEAADDGTVTVTALLPAQMLVRAGAERVGRDGRTRRAAALHGLPDAAYLVDGVEGLTVRRRGGAGDAPLEIASPEEIQFWVYDLGAPNWPARVLAPFDARAVAPDALRDTLRRRSALWPHRPENELNGVVGRMRGAGFTATAARTPAGTQQVEWAFSAPAELWLRRGDERRESVRARRSSGVLSERTRPAGGDGPAQRWFDRDVRLEGNPQGTWLTRRPDGRWAEYGLDGAEAGTLRVVATGTGAQHRIRATGDGGVGVTYRVRPKGWKPGDARDDRAVDVAAATCERFELHARGAPADLRRLLLDGRVRLGLNPGAPPGPDGRARAQAVGDRLACRRTPNADGTVAEAWKWTGFRDARGPAAGVFDLGGGPWTLRGAQREEWRLRAPDAEATRFVRRRGSRWETESLTVTAPNGLTLEQYAAAGDAAAKPAGELSARDCTITLAPDPSGALRVRTLHAGGGVGYRSTDSARGLAAAEAREVKLSVLATGQGDPDGEQWVFIGDPVRLRAPADYRPPIGVRALPKPGDGRVEYRGTCRRACWVRRWQPAAAGGRWADALQLRDAVTLEQWGPGAAGTPVREWHLATEQMDLLRADARRQIDVPGPVDIRNFGPDGAEQGRVRASALTGVAARPADGSAGEGVARFGAPFVAEGLATPHAYVQLGQVGGQRPIAGRRVRLVAPNGASASRAGRVLHLQAAPLYLQMLGTDGAVQRTLKSADGMDITETASGEWEFSGGGHGLTLGLTAKEVEALAKLAKGP